MAEAVPALHVVLASASPRRLELVRRLGLEPDVRPTDVDESPRSGEEAAGLAGRLAVAKCRASDAPSAALVIAADTVVELDGRPLGKPVDPEDAATMLAALSGRDHHVRTGVAVRHAGREADAVITTVVSMRRLTDEEISAYVASGEPMDKAGAYAIQGRAGAFVTAIAGSASNVVGLPLAQTVDLARQVGVDLLASGSPAHGAAGA